MAMATLIADPWLEEELKEKRRAWGIDGHDEVWDGVYFIPPRLDNEHQKLVAGLGAFLYTSVDTAGLGEAFMGVNLARLANNWEHDYRVPDVAAFLKETAATDCNAFWQGAADFLIEIITPGDRTYEKLPFYSRLGVRELLIVDRRPWKLELYRRGETELEHVGASTPPQSDVLASVIVPLRFQLVASQPRPRIEISDAETGQHWTL
jgi:hypothetical protein